MKLSSIKSFIVPGLVTCFALATNGFAAADPQRVVAALHHVNQLEAQAGAAAVSKSAREDVRAYGETLFDDHTQFDATLQEVAEREGIPVIPFEPVTEQEKEDMAVAVEMAQLLAELEGEEFDAAFLEGMVDGHERVIRQLQQALPEIENVALKTLVSELLPHLEHHRQLAEQLSQVE